MRDLVLGWSLAVALGLLAIPDALAQGGGAAPNNQAGQGSVPSQAGGPARPTSYNQIVQGTLQPQAEELLKRLVQEGRAMRLEGVPVFDGTDKFLPGKIAVGLTDFLLALPRDEPRLSAGVPAHCRHAGR